MCSEDSSGESRGFPFRGRLQEVVDSMLAGDLDIAEFGTGPGPGLIFWLLRDPETDEGFRMVAVPPEFDRMSEDALGFTPSVARPLAYPDDMPFLPDCAVIVNPGPSGVALYWIDPQHPVNALRHLVEECLTAGWEQLDPGPVPMATRESRYIEFRKPGSSRAIGLRIVGSGGELTMLEPAR